MKALNTWKSNCAKDTLEAYNTLRDRMFAGELDVASHLGSTKNLYNFVRQTVDVQVRKGDVEHGAFQNTIGVSSSRGFSGMKADTS